MYELQEVEIVIPYTSYTTGKTYKSFDDYYNNIFKGEFDLINVQILTFDEYERTYMFWHRYKG
jgi:hypothetical protein